MVLEIVISTDVRDWVDVNFMSLLRKEMVHLATLIVHANACIMATR